MEIAKVTVSGVKAQKIWAEQLTAGIVGATVKLEYTDPMWNGLIKNVAFKGVVETPPILDVGDTVYLPAEVVSEPNVLVKIGVTGISEDGIEIIPTLWAELGVTYPAAPTDLEEGVEEQAPVPSPMVQMELKLHEHDKEIARSGSELFKDPVTGEIFLMRDEKKLGEGIPGLGALQFDGGYVDQNGYLHLTMGGEDVEGFEPFYVGTGAGGGGGANSYTITITNLMDSRVFAVPEGERVVLRFRYSSVDNEGMEDGSGLGQLLIGGVVRHSFSAKQGENELDITDYLSSGTNNVSVRITNSEDSSKSMAYTVTVAALSLTSPFDASVPQTGAFGFPYTPTGIAEKEMHFEVDGVVIGNATITTSGRQQSYTIPAQTHGAHILRAWFTCSINGTEVSSNVLYYGLICTVEGNTTTIAALTAPPIPNVEQFSNIVNRFRFYSPTSLTSAITLEVDGKVVSSQTVDRTEQTWTYRPDTVGQITMTIRCGEVSLSWTHNVTESSIKVEPETEALALDLSSYGRSNNETNPGVWESNGVSAEFTGFNFVSDGWVQDEEDNTVLRVTGDARLHIPYRMFANDFRTTGKTLEFEFTTRQVLNDDAVILSCWNGSRGFRLTARQMQLASEQSSLGTPYKANDHIHVAFVIQKRSEHRLILCYINGIMSGAVQYPEDDDFSQPEPVGITIGSNECTVDLYSIRALDNGLTRHQVVNDWIAGTQNIHQRLERYKRNDIYDEYGRVVIERLPGNLCYMVIRCEELPKFKGDKKKCSGYFVDLIHPERSFSFTDAEIDVQGTSSQFYVVKNLKGKFKAGFIMSDGTVMMVYEMDDGTIGVSVFTMKADVASSEGAYNTVSAILYNDLNPFTPPAKEEDPRVRHSINGFPCVIFHESSAGLKFIGKYNFNLDKGTPEPFGLTEGDERWEVLENGNPLGGFHSADFSGDGWKEVFEGNYPDGNTDITKLQAMCSWVNSTDTEQATGENIAPVTLGGTEYTADTAEYRLAKFKQELADWFVPKATDWYKLFTELLLCMDQLEKNVLWHYDHRLARWWADYYDGDSIIGHNNQAQPVFEYWMEDIDYTESGDPVYNGQNNVFWKNVRLTRHDEIKKLYQEMRTDGRLSYDVVYNAIAEHQSYWPEAIFNEDMQIKCLDALENDGDSTYLSFLRGKKELWTKDFLYKRFRYMDSKYETGDSLKNRMTIRTNKLANLTLTFCMKLLAHAYYNAETVEIRVEKDVPYEFVSQATGAEDRVIGINDADKLTSLGDLAPHDVELIDLSPCEMLTEIKLGDGAEDYVNYSLTSVTFGNNILLRKADIRNCPNLAIAPDVSGCTNIEEFLAEGSGITGIKLPNGGILKTLHLPGTVVSLQIVNQPQLADFSIPAYSQITTLRLENAGAAGEVALDILKEMPDNSRVRVLGISYEAADSASLDALIRKLEAMRGLDENGNNVDVAQISGHIHAASISYVMSTKIDTLAAKYPSLTITYDAVEPAMTHKFLMRTISGEYENERVTTIGASAFQGCTGLTCVRFPNVTTIGNSAFHGCTGLTEVSAPLATETGTTVFQNCNRLVKIDLATQSAFAANMFQNCHSLTALILRGDTMVTLSATNAFTNCYHLTGTANSTWNPNGLKDGYIYVPAALIDSYKAATNWSTYADQFRAVEDYPEICGGE